MGGIWFSDTPPSGYAILDGSTLTNAQTNYPSLWANVHTSWKSGSNIILPDMRGRVPVGKGSHVDIDTLGDSDGIATVANRRPKHKHSTTIGAGTLATGNDTPDHTHPVQSAHAGSGVQFSSGAAAPPLDINQSGGASTRHTHPITGSPTVTVGPQTGAEPTDGAAYLVVNFIIKLA